MVERERALFFFYRVIQEKKLKVSEDGKASELRPTKRAFCRYFTTHEVKKENVPKMLARIDWLATMRSPKRVKRNAELFILAGSLCSATYSIEMTRSVGMAQETRREALIQLKASDVEQDAESAHLSWIEREFDFM